MNKPFLYPFQAKLLKSACTSTCEKTHLLYPGRLQHLFNKMLRICYLTCSLLDTGIIFLNKMCKTLSSWGLHCNGKCRPPDSGRTKGAKVTRKHPPAFLQVIIIRDTAWRGSMKKEKSVKAFALTDFLFYILVFLTDISRFSVTSGTVYEYSRN